MQLSVLGLQESINLQHQINPTKILSVIDTDVVDYFDSAFRDKITQIRVLDFETFEDHVNIPSMKHVGEIIHFTQSLKEDDRVLVHCFAGLSRSTAAAFILAFYKTQSIETAINIMMQVRPQARPNRRLCYLADQYFDHYLPYLYNAANDEKCFPNMLKEFSNHKGQL